VWLLEELNLEYELKVFKRDKDFRAGEDLKAVHPLGKSPVIGITPAGSDKETIIAESETIVDYVCEHFGRHMIPQRYPEGKEGVLGAENEEFMRYRVRRLSLACRFCGNLACTTKRQHHVCMVADGLIGPQRSIVSFRPFFSDAIQAFLFTHHEIWTADLMITIAMLTKHSS
jgi:hypothetical protein